MFLTELFVFTILFGYVIYKWSVSTFKTFSARGVPCDRPVPLLGNAAPFLRNAAGLHKVMIDLHLRTKQHKIYGFYNFRDPFFTINDPNLIKKMAIKDFDAFTNHQPIFDTSQEPLLAGMLTIMKDQRWKNMRNTVTPIFTGSKMRSMFALMNECFVEAMDYLREQSNATSNEDGAFELRMKECFCRLSNDLIATTAFGLKVNSFKDKDNEFFTIGTSFSKARFQQSVKFMINSLSPVLFKLLRLRMFPKGQTDYFLRLVLDAMRYREEHNISRPDMIQLLMEAKRESAHNWSNEDIVAQCFIFFFAAFENNANLLCTTCYELAENPDVQAKLHDEIMQVEAELNGKALDYEILNKLKYLDMVVQESLRKWSLAPMIDRECGRDYKVEDDDGNFICNLKAGDRIWFQVIGLHWDPEYFEHPEVFEPERFSAENKDKIKPFTYNPFGVGPRACIGNRYALMQGKAMLYYLIKEFQLLRSDKMCDDLLASARGFSLEPSTGWWVKFKQRTATHI